MPQRFFRLDDLLACGVKVGDVRGQARRTYLETWRLPDLAVKTLRSLLIRTGFNPDRPINVHEVPETPGFFFKQ